MLTIICVCMQIAETPQDIVQPQNANAIASMQDNSEPEITKIVQGHFELKSLLPRYGLKPWNTAIYDVRAWAFKNWLMFFMDAKYSMRIVIKTET